MLDLHCHILPGVDDGAASVDEALALARFCVRDGITHVVATPHCHRHCRMLRADVLPHVARLNEDLTAAGVPLTVLPGSEVQVTDTGVYRREFEAGLYCHLGDGRAFTLLEFSWKVELYPPDAAELVAWLRGQGMTPIVAHTERHGFFTDDPGWLRALVEAGAWLYPDAVLATDAHNLRRCSGLSAGYTWVRERFGVGRAEELRVRADQVLAALVCGDEPVAPADGAGD